MSYKNILKVLLIGVLAIIIPYVFADDNIFSDTWELPYCDNNDCWYQSWVKKVKWMIDNAETSKTLSEYIQDVVVYLLTFISIIAVIYIIYAWFRILIWWWNDESVKNSRKTILNVAIWIVIIWLAFSLVSFFLEVLWWASELGT